MFCQKNPNYSSKKRKKNEVIYLAGELSSVFLVGMDWQGISWGCFTLFVLSTTVCKEL